MIRRSNRVLRCPGAWRSGPLHSLPALSLRFPRPLLPVLREAFPSFDPLAALRAGQSLQLASPARACGVDGRRRRLVVFTLGGRRPAPAGDVPRDRRSGGRRRPGRRSGRPPDPRISGPEKFEVTIDGRKRRVVSANFVRSVTSANDSDPPLASTRGRRAERSRRPAAAGPRLHDRGGREQLQRRRLARRRQRGHGIHQGAAPGGPGRPVRVPGRRAIGADDRSPLGRSRKLNTIVGAATVDGEQLTTSRRPRWWTSPPRAPRSSPGLGRATAAAVAANPASTPRRRPGALRRVQMRECGGVDRSNVRGQHPARRRVDVVLLRRPGDDGAERPDVAHPRSVGRARNARPSCC